VPNIDELQVLILTIISDNKRKPTAAVSKLLRELKVREFDGNNLQISAPGKLAAEWLYKNCEKNIIAKIEDKYGISVNLNIVDEQLPLLHVENALLKNNKSANNTQTIEHKDADMEDDFLSVPLNSRYTFDQFVIGSNNYAAAEAAKLIARANGRQVYNPLFIYGGAGLGKTHLMQAIGNEMLKKNPNAKVKFISGENFTFQVVNATQQGHNSFVKFKRHYQDIDLWLVDDIQTIASKERTESEFFQIFNFLHDTKKQIIITSDRPPKNLRILDERLRSRFEWGLMVDIKSPDFETRKAILEQLALMEGVRLSPDIISYMASVITANVRVLEGAMTKLLVYKSITSAEITLNMTMDLLKDHTLGITSQRMTISDIQSLVCNKYNISQDALNGKSRRSDVVIPRQIAMYLSRELLNVSFPEIGRSFGDRDHSTVMYACDKLASQMKIDKEISQIIDELSSEIRKKS